MVVRAVAMVVLMPMPARQLAALVCGEIEAWNSTAFSPSETKATVSVNDAVTPMPVHVAFVVV
jgi:hypothetical protein